MAVYQAELQQLLSERLKKIRNGKRSVGDDVIRELAEKYKFNTGVASDLITGNILTEYLDGRQIYQLASVIIDNFNAEDYFGKSKIELYSKPEKPEETYPIEFENVLQISEDQFLTTISTQKIRELYNKAIIYYNLATQRDPKIYTVDGKTEVKIRINKSSVSQIKYLLIENKFIPNALTWNVRNGEESGVWDYSSGLATFELKANGFDIIDGFHRYLAIVQALRINPELDIQFPLYIVVFNEDKAKRFIAQEDKRNKINPYYSKALDIGKFEHRVLTLMNKDSDFVFYDSFGVLDNARFNFGKTMTTIGQLYGNKGYDSQFEILSLKNYLIKSFNELINESPKLEKTFSGFDVRVALCCFYLFKDDPKKIQNTVKYIKYFNSSRSDLRHESSQAIIKAIQRHEEKQDVK